VKEKAITWNGSPFISFWHKWTLDSHSFCSGVENNLLKIMLLITIWLTIFPKITQSYISHVSENYTWIPYFIHAILPKNPAFHKSPFLFQYCAKYGFVSGRDFFCKPSSSIIFTLNHAMLFFLWFSFLHRSQYFPIYYYLLFQEYEDLSNQNLSNYKLIEQTNLANYELGKQTNSLNLP